VFREPFVCVARRGHPVLHDGNLPLDRYVELQHVQVLPGNATMYAAAIDTTLAAIDAVTTAGMTGKQNGLAARASFAIRWFAGWGTSCPQPWCR
jgi:hypothetical protein